MSLHVQPSGPTGGRKTYTLSCTHVKPPVGLDFPSHLAVRWLTQWVTQQGGLKAPQSGLIRRALHVYVRHVQSLPPEDITGELRSLKWACSGSSTRPQDREEAEGRLEAPEGPLLPFEVVLHGQAHVDHLAAVMRHLEPLNHIPGMKEKPT